MKITFSLAQLHIQLGQPEKNLATAADMIAAAARSGSQLILFPELWVSGYDMENAGRYAAQYPEYLAEISRLARQYQTAVGGSYVTARDGRLYNTFSLVFADERPVVSYDKIHLFRMFDEHKWLHPGSEMRQYEAPWGNTGLAICYDLRFPELFRHYALNGAVVNLLPAEWGLHRVLHWRTLIRARAIENQVFMVAVGAVGKIGAETFAGSSAIISPWGEALAEANDREEALLSAEVDLDQVAQVRTLVPVFGDRRPDIYYE